MYVSTPTLKKNEPKMYNFFSRFTTPDIIHNNNNIEQHTHRHKHGHCRYIGSHCNNNNNNTDKQIQRVHSHVVKCM